jgi:large subunit ribosomal protein L21
MPDSTYAIVKCGGKQYRVEEGTTLLVDRITDDEGASIDLVPLLYAGDKDTVFSASDLGRIKVKAKVLAHERGPKLRVFKFKPKRGYKRTTGHRSELTRIEVTGISLGRGSSSKKEAEDGS